QGFFALRFGELVPHQPGGRVGQRGAETVHLLILHRVVYRDGEIRRARRAKHQRQLLPQSFVLLFRRLDHLDARSAAGRGRFLPRIGRGERKQETKEVADSGKSQVPNWEDRKCTKTKEGREG